MFSGSRHCYPRFLPSHQLTLFTHLKNAPFFVAAIWIFLCGASQLLASVATTTTLGVTSGGSTVTTVTSGSAITLTATVTVGGTAVTPGQVNFCDASAPYCTDIHIIGTAQLSPAGTATLTLVPGNGVHSYKAVFLGTGSDATSSSSVTTLTVTGSGRYSTTTSITQTGSTGNYTLTATVSGGEDIVPSGTVSFLDTNNSNYVLGTAALGGGQNTPTFGFTASSTPATNSYPQSVTVADFNGDGKADLAIPLANESTPVSILLGNGDGTFTAAPATPISGLYEGAGSAVAGDFNGDGKADLAITAPDIDTVVVMLGNGDGTFTAGQTIADTDGPFFITTGDFNGDGKADLAVANPGGQDVTILLGNGDGTFTTASTVAVGGEPDSIAVADFNGDGNADLATVNENTNSVTVLLGAGDGTFNEASSSPATGYAPVSIVTGDFNGDGKPDLAVANSNVDTLEPGSVTILLGVGDGTFTPGAATLATGYLPYSVAVGDFNGDGKADLVTANASGNVAIVSNGIGIGTATVLLGNGDGTFATAASPAAGENPLFAAVGDFNGDGFADLVAVNGVTNSVTVLLSELTETASVTVSGISLLGTGNHAVSARYPGDVNYSASVSGTTALTAQPATTKLSLSANATSTTSGGPIVLTATLSPFLVQGLSATGTVSFYNDGTNLGTAALSNGAATLDVASLPAGTNSITASYSGDANFAAATASSIDVTISAQAPITTKLSLSANATSTTSGGPIVLTATLSPSVVQGLSATGTVSFFNGSTNLGAAPLSNGAATLDVASLPAGTNSITASYSGDANFAGVTSSSINVTISAQVAATLTLSANPSSSTYGGQVVLTATLSPSVVQGLSATGTVSFYNGSASLGVAALTGGVATLNVTSLPVGTGDITASYSGDANFPAATSTVTNVTVSAPIAPDFSISVNPSTLTLGQGATGTAAFTITPTGGFNQTLQFSCSGLPANSSCTFSPASITPNGAAVVSTLTITTNVQTASVPLQRTSWLAVAIFFCPGGFASVLGCLGLRRRKLSPGERFFICLFLVLGVLTMGLITGCGGSNGQVNSGGGPITPSGTNTVSVMASSTGSSGLSHNASLTVTITN